MPRVPPFAPKPPSDMPRGRSCGKGCIYGLTPHHGHSRTDHLVHLTGQKQQSIVVLLTTIPGFNS
jgi:hypothetical protein